MLSAYESFLFQATMKQIKNFQRPLNLYTNTYLKTFIITTHCAKKPICVSNFKLYCAKYTN